MTASDLPHRLRRALVPALLAAAVAVRLAPAAAAEPPSPAAGASAQPPLPRGVVARVKGSDLTLAEFHRHLSQRLSPEIDDEKSPTHHTFRMAVEEMAVEQEARRLGIVVTKDDVDRRFAELETALRVKAGGKTTLADMMKATKTSAEEFRHNLTVQVTKEKVAAHPSYLGARLPVDEAARLAQIEVAMGQILAKAKVERTGLAPGVVARVNGEPFTEEAFGRAIDLRMPTARYLSEHIQSIVLRDIPLSDEAFDAAIVVERAVWERVRLLDPRAEMHTVSYDDYLQATQGRTLAELRRDPYFRGVVALKARVRAEVTDDEVRKAWVADAHTKYGPLMEVLDFQVSFKIPNAVVEHVQRRTREEAQRIVGDYARRIREKEPVDRIVQEVQARKTAEGRPDRSIQAVKRTVRDTDNGQIVFQEAAKLKDGEWSAPFETISEFHLVRRERLIPAPTFEGAREQVRHDLVVWRANDWLHRQLNDPAVVRIAGR